jgi:hypothetical protein
VQSPIHNERWGRENCVANTYFQPKKKNKKEKTLRKQVDVGGKSSE